MKDKPFEQKWLYICVKIKTYIFKSGGVYPFNLSNIQYINKIICLPSKINIVPNYL